MNRRRPHFASETSLMQFMGLLSEYVGAIHTQKRPWGIERERINFEHEPGPARAR